VLDGFFAYAFLQDNPTTPAIQVAGLKEIDYDIVFQTSGGYDATGDHLTVVIEAALGRAVDIDAQQKLDLLHRAQSLKAAIEADPKLTSRLQDDGTVLAGQAAACDSLRVARYVGQTPFILENTVRVLLATWEVEVVT
jgi:hypothetical protein